MSKGSGNEIDVSVFEAIRTMRAMRRLKPDPVPRELLEQIVELASCAPTGGNTQIGHECGTRIDCRTNRQQTAAIFAVASQTGCHSLTFDSAVAAVAATFAAENHVAATTGDERPLLPDW
jgi:Nitroreductase family